ncbi:MAG: primosomal protein N' [Bacillota bacterium]|nr:primosomal protein N' [Bacillota bacterium]
MAAYAEIIVDLISNAIDRPFHYSIPPHLQETLRPGMQVTVPLGHRQYQGYVLRLLNETAISPLRDIIDISDPEPLLTDEQLALAHWLSMRYYCRKIDAIHAMLPASLRRGQRAGSVQVIELTPESTLADLSRAPARKKAVRLLAEKGPLTRGELKKNGISPAIIRTLEKMGLIRYTTVRRETAKAKTVMESTEPYLLRGEQDNCYNLVCDALNSEKAQMILLHGVTASGKTEIYMQSIARCIEQNRTALIMVPEIALTPQMVELFEGRFPGLIAVIHSRLTPAEKNREWQDIIDGRARVVLGARSAVFAPIDTLGLIVIDEEHETTYKQEETPRYHAREVAWWRARYNRAVLLLGSATPSVESFYKARTGELKLLSMQLRVTPTQLPPVEIVDMRSELKEGHRHIFSRPLLEELGAVLERDEQALLFINRRGFSGFVLCRECGYVVSCPSCDVSLTLHLDRQLMCCHYCAHEAPIPETCPGCGGHKIRYFSAGTQKVEDEVKKLYPHVSLIRMDSDTTTNRHAHNRYYRQFRERRASILIGTQMIAKGFDFPDVTLVGVVAADTTLNLPDFRAPERTFQLLTQVAGRTARGPRGGKVIIQTYHPNHYSIQTAAKHDYLSFFDSELAHRHPLAYPPYTDLVRILFSGDEEKKVFEAAHWFAGLLSFKPAEAEILGPAPASLFRIKDQYRVQVILKGERLTRIAPTVRKAMREYYDHKPAWTVRLAVDFNPLVVL